MILPEYARLRVAQEPPDGCCVPVGTVPTIAYGDPAEARVATIGLNPGHGHQRSARRDAEPIVAPNAQEGKYGYDYFEVFGDAPGYFRPLERIIVACGASYLDGSACHLDLAQWPTSERWSDLPKKCAADAQGKLLADGVHLFKQQLMESHGIRLLLGDGIRVKEQMEGRLGVEAPCIDTLTVSGYKRTMRVFSGEALDRFYIGWNWPLIRIGSKMVEKLAQRVSEIARERGVRS